MAQTVALAQADGLLALDDLAADSMRLRAHASTKAVRTLSRSQKRLAELMRLLRSLRKRHLLERVGPRGCARFFAAYVGGDRTLRRALLAGLGRERFWLALHTLHYR